MKAPTRRSWPVALHYLAAIGAATVAAGIAHIWRFDNALSQPFAPAVGVAVAGALLAPRRHRTPIVLLATAISCLVSHIVLGDATARPGVALVCADLIAAGIGLRQVLALLRSGSGTSAKLTLEWFGLAMAASCLGALAAALIASPSFGSWTFVWQRSLGVGLALYAIGPISLLAHAGRRRPLRGSPTEIAFTVALLVATAVYSLHSVGPVIYLVLPPLVWLCVRSGPLLVEPLAIALVTYVCVETSRGHGPFVTTATLSSLQVFITIVLVSASALTNFEEVSEQQIARSDDRWRRLSAAAQEGIAEIDEDSVIVFANVRFGEIVGVPHQELLGLHVTDFIGDERWMELVPAREELEQGNGLVLELGLGAGSAVPRWGLVSASPQMTDDGRYRGAILLVTDISALKSAEIERIDLVDELASVERTERARLARYLHDGPLQDLTAVHMILGHLVNERPEEPIVAKASAAMTDALAVLRSGVTALDPVDVANGSIAEALRRHGHRATAGSNVRTEVVTHGRVPTGPTALVVYRVAREAITNAAKHAHATEIMTTIREDPGGYQLRVVDDGRGFITTQVTISNNLGLRSMRERTEQAKGHMTVESTPGVGTTVCIWIPDTAPVDLDFV